MAHGAGTRFFSHSSKWGSIFHKKNVHIKQTFDFERAARGHLHKKLACFTGIIDLHGKKHTFCFSGNTISIERRLGRMRHGQ